MKNTKKQPQKAKISIYSVVLDLLVLLLCGGIITWLARDITAPEMIDSNMAPGFVYADSISSTGRLVRLVVAFASIPAVEIWWFVRQRQNIWPILVPLHILCVVIGLALWKISVESGGRDYTLLWVGIVQLVIIPLASLLYARRS